MHPDGSDLPRAPSTGGGVVKVLREECRTSQSLKGKAGEKRDSPPHMAHYASLQTGGEDCFIKDIFAISSSPPTAFLVTRSQIKDTRFDPLKGKHPEKHTNGEQTQDRVLTHRRMQPTPSTSTPNIVPQASTPDPALPEQTQQEPLQPWPAPLPITNP